MRQRLSEFFDFLFYALGQDGMACTALMIAGVLRGVAYQQQGLILAQKDFIHSTIGLDTAAGIWYLGAALCAISLLVPRLRGFALGVQVSIHTAWCVSLGLLTWQTSGQEIYATSIGFGLIAVLTIWGISRQETSRSGDKPLDRIRERLGDDI